MSWMEERRSVVMQRSDHRLRGTCCCGESSCGPLIIVSAADFVYAGDPEFIMTRRTSIARASLSLYWLCLRAEKIW